MNHLKIINTGGRGIFTHIEMDGKPLNRVRDLKVHFSVDGIVTATMEVLVDSIEIETDADVHVVSVPAR